MRTRRREMEMVEYKKITHRCGCDGQHVCMRGETLWREFMAALGSDDQRRATAFRKEYDAHHELTQEEAEDRALEALIVIAHRPELDPFKGKR